MRLRFVLNGLRLAAAIALQTSGHLFGADIFTYQVTLACRIVHRLMAMKAV